MKYKNNVNAGREGRSIDATRGVAKVGEPQLAFDLEAIGQAPLPFRIDTDDPVEKEVQACFSNKFSSQEIQDLNE